MSTAEGIARAIKARLIWLHRTQIDLAGALDMSQTALTRRLSGNTAWTVEELERAAECLGVDIHDLIPAADQRSA